MAGPKRSLQLVAAGVGIVVVAATAGYVAGRGGSRDAQAAPSTPTTRAAAGHAHGTGQPAAADVPQGPTTGVKAKRTWVDPDGNRFTIWVAFGPPAGGGMCTVGGGGYVRGMVIMVQSDAKNRAAPGPRIGATGNLIAFQQGEYACNRDFLDSAEHRFKPGEAKTFTGLVDRVQDPRKAVLRLTIGVGKPRKPRVELAKIPYASIFA
jgi:hypothetical protein